MWKLTQLVIRASPVMEVSCFLGLMSTFDIAIFQAAIHICKEGLNASVSTLGLREVLVAQMMRDELRKAIYTFLTSNIDPHHFAASSISSQKVCRAKSFGQQRIYSIDRFFLLLVPCGAIYTWGENSERDDSSGLSAFVNCFPFSPALWQVRAGTHFSTE